MAWFQKRIATPDLDGDNMFAMAYATAGVETTRTHNSARLSLVDWRDRQK